jgi:hypothetical protein
MIKRACHQVDKIPKEETEENKTTDKSQLYNSWENVLPQTPLPATGLMCTLPLIVSEAVQMALNI